MLSRIKTLAGIVFVLCCLIGCNDDLATVTTTEIKIGALVPLTGGLSAVGANQKTVLEAALVDVNLDLENKDAPIRLALEFKDSGSNGTTSLEALKALVAEGVTIVVGPSASSACAAILDYATQQGVVLISPASTQTSLAIADDNLLRLIPPSIRQAEGLAELLHGDGKTVVIPMWLNDAWASEFQGLVADAFVALGGEAATGMAYDTGDYTALLTAMDVEVSKLITQYGADSVALILASFEEGIDILALANAYPSLSQVSWYSAEALANNQDLLANSKAAAFAAQVNLTAAIFSLRDEVITTPKIVLTDRSLREELKLNAGRNLPDDSFAAYDILWLCRKGLEANGWATEATSFMNAVFQESANYVGLTGALGLSDTGDQKGYNFAFYTVNNNAGTPVWSLRAAYSQTFNTANFRYVTATPWPGLDTAPLTVTIGALLNITGTAMEVSKGIEAALQESLSAVNRHMIAAGYPTTFSLVIKDIGESSALKQLDALAAMGIKVVIGPILSQDCHEVREAAASYGMTLISPSSTDSSLSLPDSLFRFVAPDTVQGQALAKYATDQGIQDMVAVVRDDSWGLSVYMSTAIAMDELGGRISSVIGYSSDEFTKANIDEKTKIMGILEGVVEDMTTGESALPADSVAVFLVSLEEGIQILETAQYYPHLSNVRWFTADGLVKREDLLSNDVAATFAATHSLTGPIYDIQATHPGTTPSPLPRDVYINRITQRLGQEASPYAYPAWDAFYTAALAYIQDGWDDTATTYQASLVSAATGHIALNGFMAMDANGDQRFGHYAFYELTDKGKTYDWTRDATYHFHLFGPSDAWITEY